MYTKQVPCKDLDGKPRNVTVHFNLYEIEAFKLIGEFQRLQKQIEQMQSEDLRELSTEEVVEFMTDFEEICLSAYGKPSDDKLSFDHDGRYDYQKSVVHNAFLMMVLTDPSEANKFITEILPADMDELVKKADENLAKAAKEMDNETAAAEIARLRQQLAAAESNQAGDEQAS